MTDPRSPETTQPWDAQEQLGGAQEPVVEPVEESPEMAAAVEDDTLLPETDASEDDADLLGYAEEPPS